MLRIWGRPSALYSLDGPSALAKARCGGFLWARFASPRRQTILGGSPWIQLWIRALDVGVVILLAIGQAGADGCGVNLRGMK